MALGADMSSVLFGRLAFAVAATALIAAFIKLLSDETFLYWSPEQRDLVPVKGDWELLYGGSSDCLKTLTYKR